MKTTKHPKPNRHESGSTNPGRGDVDSGDAPEPPAPSTRTNGSITQAALSTALANIGVKPHSGSTSRISNKPLKDLSNVDFCNLIIVKRQPSSDSDTVTPSVDVAAVAQVYGPWILTVLKMTKKQLQPPTLLTNETALSGWTVVSRRRVAAKGTQGVINSGPVGSRAHADRTKSSAWTIVSSRSGAARKVSFMAFKQTLTCLHTQTNPYSLSSVVASLFSSGHCHRNAALQASLRQLFRDPPHPQ